MLGTGSYTSKYQLHSDTPRMHSFKFFSWSDLQGVKLNLRSIGDFGDCRNLPWNAEASHQPGNGAKEPSEYGPPAPSGRGMLLVLKSRQSTLRLLEPLEEGATPTLTLD